MSTFLLKIIFAFCLVFSIGKAFGQENNVNKKPNVLLIYTDDHRFSGIHTLAGLQVQTPNIDQLAKDGITFTKTYLMGSFSGATCIPSRAMLLTGKNLFTLDGVGRNIPKNDTTIAEAFQKEGYDTHIVGKWHQDNASLNRSFNSGDKIMGRSAYLTDHFRMPFWDFNKNSNYTRKEAYLLVYDKKGKRIKRSLTKEDKKGPIGTERIGPHTSEVFAEHASNYIKKSKKEKPFFMYLAFHAPHDPRQAPQEYLDKYNTKNIKLPPSYLPQHPFDNGAMTVRDEALAPWPRTNEIAKKHLAEYYAIITHLDAQIGKVIQALKDSGAYKNTIIVLAGDSGLAVGNHGLIGKQNVYDEDGLHVPFIISGNYIKQKGRKIDALSYIQDIFPTICDLANLKKPKSMNGKSLKPVIDYKTEQIRQSTYHAYKQFQRAYRKGDFKLIEYVKANGNHWKNGPFIAGARVTQLFNIKDDFWETTDLSFLPQYKEKVALMRKEMKAKADELGDVKVTSSKEREYHFWDYYN
ncbi:arylsulfatase [Polaribacter reichenbachii]|uniref:Arylsulfatase n=1 Tax=Polaribacter reichenbachii TaxID=996801 RepID=A0A1B8TUS9_9FLAO|nr:sulfatase-like hydrolase/transferase [Polaribacter reichenbachii]APZ45560.1 arylsulfatase [Polaribacter reichenbachii]AUC19422.1 arylsulfatase [Polaribacter reichenbachii]OBY63423.1 arylsulfatase [Polaribacter reichenbachii]